MPPVNGVGEPCAGEPHARFDAAGAGTGAPGHGTKAASSSGSLPALLKAMSRATSGQPQSCFCLAARTPDVDSRFAKVQESLITFLRRTLPLGRTSAETHILLPLCVKIRVIRHALDESNPVIGG